MKMSVGPQTQVVEIRTESTDELFLLGKLAVKIKGAHVYPQQDGQRMLQVQVSDLIIALDQPNR